MAKWIVHTKGGPEQEFFEIAVLHEDNELGVRSYGWFGDDKLLISHNGGPCHWPVTVEVWQGLVALAEQVAAQLNGEEPDAGGWKCKHGFEICEPCAYDRGFADGKVDAPSGAGTSGEDSTITISDGVVTSVPKQSPRDSSAWDAAGIRLGIGRAEEPEVLEKDIAWLRKISERRFLDLGPCNDDEEWQAVDRILAVLERAATRREGETE